MRVHLTALRGKAPMRNCPTGRIIAQRKPLFSTEAPAMTLVEFVIGQFVRGLDIATGANVCLFAPLFGAGLWGNRRTCDATAR